MGINWCSLAKRYSARTPPSPPHHTVPRTRTTEGKTMPQTPATVPATWAASALLLLLLPPHPLFAGLPCRLERRNSWSDDDDDDGDANERCLWTAVVAYGVRRRK